MGSDYTARRMALNVNQKWLTDPANQYIVNAFRQAPNGQKMLDLIMGQDGGSSIAKRAYDIAGGNPTQIANAINNMPHDSGSLGGSLGAFIQSSAPILEAAALVGGAALGANALSGTSMFGGTPAASGLTTEQLAGPAMSPGYTAPVIATPSNTLAALTSPSTLPASSSLTQSAINSGTVPVASAMPVATSTLPSATAVTTAAPAAASLIPGISNNALGSIASGGASLLGAGMASSAAKDAAALQAQYGQAAIDEARRQFDIGQTNQKPWMTGGQTALGAQLDLMGLPGGTTGSSTNSLAELQKSPGYQFRLDQGNQAINRSAAAKGMLNSGNVLAELANYGQGMASTEYGNRLNQLGALSGVGQSAASGMANQGANYANQYGNTMTGIGNAQAAGNIASGNAWQSGILGAGTSLSNFFNPPAAQPSFKMVNGQWSYV